MPPDTKSPPKQFAPEPIYPPKQFAPQTILPFQEVVLVTKERLGIECIERSPLHSKPVSGLVHQSLFLQHIVAVFVCAYVLSGKKVLYHSVFYLLPLIYMCVDIYFRLFSDWRAENYHL